MNRNRLAGFILTGLGAALMVTGLLLVYGMLGSNAGVGIACIGVSAILLTFGSMGLSVSGKR